MECWISKAVNKVCFIPNFFKKDHYGNILDLIFGSSVEGLAK